MKKTKLSTEQKDFINGKIRKVQGLSNIIQDQKKFIEQETSNFLE